MQYGHWIVISSDLVPQLLRMFFNFPNFETMMYKAHPFNFQELEHTFSQAKNTFKDNLRKRDKTSCIKMFLCRPLDTETTHSIYFQFAHSSCSSVGVLEKQIHPSECEDKHWLLRKMIKVKDNGCKALTAAGKEFMSWISLLFLWGHRTLATTPMSFH